MRMTEDGRITKGALATVAAVVALVGVLVTVFATRDSGQSTSPEQASVQYTTTVTTSTVTTSTSTTSTTTTTPTTTTEPPPPTTVAPPEAVVAPSAPPPAPARRCVVRLHGKGGNGAGTTAGAGGWLELNPRGNAQGWGGWQWLYFPASSYASAVAIVERAITDNGCTASAVVGFSNGGAFAAKLACRGETFGGRVVGYVVDDPVPDRSTGSCGRSVPVVLYWTGGLASTAKPGWACSQADWTCEGGETIGIDATGANLGVPVKASVNNGHSPYPNPPELRAWLG